MHTSREGQRQNVAVQSNCENKRSDRESSDIVVDHYNDRRQKTRDERKESPVYALRCVNNWIKTVLIDDHVAKHATYLDLCGGRGGDLEKAAANHVREYTLVDIAHEEVERARQRWQESDQSARSDKIRDARFICADAFCHSARNTQDWAKPSHYDAVSCQLALHYAFESERKLRGLLRNVAQSLREDGVFICSFTDGARVYATCFDLTTQQEREFDNGVCKIRFDSGQPAYIYGTRYRFSLGDAIFECPEYCVHLPTLISEARSVGLQLVRTQTFDELCHCAFERAPQHRARWERMVRTAIPIEQWHAIGLYRACVFVRDKFPLPPPYGPSAESPPALATSEKMSIDVAKRYAADVNAQRCNAKTTENVVAAAESPSSYEYKPFEQRVSDDSGDGNRDDNNSGEIRKTTDTKETRPLVSYQDSWHEHERTRGESFVFSGSSTMTSGKRVPESDLDETECDKPVTDSSEMACDKPVKDSSEMACDKPVTDSSRMACDDCCAPISSGQINSKKVGAPTDGTTAVTTGESGAISAMDETKTTASTIIPSTMVAKKPKLRLKTNKNDQQHDSVDKQSVNNAKKTTPTSKKDAEPPQVIQKCDETAIITKKTITNTSTANSLKEKTTASSNPLKTSTVKAPAEKTALQPLKTQQDKAPEEKTPSPPPPPPPPPSSSASSSSTSVKTAPKKSSAAKSMPKNAVFVEKSVENATAEETVRVYTRKPNNVVVMRQGRALEKGERVKTGDSFAFNGNCYVKNDEEGWILRE